MDPETLKDRERQHLDGLLKLRPELGGLLGVRGHDSTLPDPSAQARASYVEALAAWSKDTVDGADGDERPRDEELDQRVFDASLDLVRFCDDELQAGARDPDVLGEVLPLLARQLLADDEPGPRFEALRDRLAALTVYIEAARASFTAADPVLVEAAQESAASTNALAAAIAREARDASGRSEIDRALADDVAKHAEALRAPLEEHAKWLDGLEDKPGSALLGTERFDQLLHLRALDITSAEMRELSGSMVEQMRLETQRLAKRAFKRAPDEALSIARSQTPLSFEEVLAWMSELVDQARSFLVDSEMFPMPSSSTLVISAAPSGLMPRLSTVILQPAPLLQTAGRARLLLPKPPNDELQHFSVADLENLAAHYAYPGAHYASAWFTEAASLMRHGAPLGLHSGPASEWGGETLAGWAHHSQELMRELMFRDSPASRLIAIREALYRALLARVDVGMHTGDFAPGRARELLVEVGGMPDDRAARDVRTLLQRPGRGVNELIGKLRLQQLRREAKIVWRHNYSEARFHELLARSGPMPLTYHFELLESPPVYSIDAGTVEYALGHDDPYLETAEEGASEPTETSSGEGDLESETSTTEGG
jgi:uncharacterized protein (DUF885 family)